MLLMIAAAQGDTAAMQRQADWSKGKQGEEAMLIMLAETIASSGELKRAREVLSRGLALAERNNFHEFVARAHARTALNEAAFGNLREARELAGTAQRLAGGKEARAYAAMALACAGETMRAQRLVDELEKKFPRDTFLTGIAFPTTRAIIEIQSNNPGKAVELLHVVTPYELGTAAGLGPIYVRGQAYLRMRDGAKAAVEFQKVLDHRGIDPVSPLSALAQLGLARAAAMAGDNVKSRLAYQNFLALWNNADPDIPLLQQAKAEYAKLQQAQQGTNLCLPECAMRLSPNV
jgi:tetratricopeptide (TPR) repeat protein